MNRFILSRLDWDDEIDFDCKDPEIDDYFRHGRKSSQQNLASVSYCLKTPDQTSVALFSLANGYFQGFDENTMGPSVNINALGVHNQYQNQGIGRNIVRFIQAFFVLNNKTGCRYLTLRASNNAKTIKFYEKYCHFIKTGEPGMATVPMYHDLMDTKNALELDPVLMRNYEITAKRIMHTGSTPFEMATEMPG